MKRVIVTPPALPPGALAELKHWLGIAASGDDAALVALLRAALDWCEAFTGVLPINAECEDLLRLSGCWQALSARPVGAITGAQGVTAQGVRTALPVDAYAIELDGDGGGRVRLTAPGTASRIAVRYTAGLAPDWDGLPDGLRHGIIRLAAHQHRARDDDGAGPVPPLAVAALWRPWRRMRLA